MDPLINLPQNNNVPSPADLEVIKTLFGDSENIAKTLNWKQILVPAIFFIVLSLPFVDSLIRNNIVDNNVLILVIKTIILIAVLIFFQLAVKK